MLNKDIYHKLVEEMKEQVGSDRGDKLKQYVYDQNMWAKLTFIGQAHNERVSKGFKNPQLNLQL